MKTVGGLVVMASLKILPAGHGLGPAKRPNEGHRTWLGNAQRFNGVHGKIGQLKIGISRSRLSEGM